MNRVVLHVASALCLVTGGGTAAAQNATPDLDAYARPTLLVDVGDGRRINIDCRGAGAPTVLLEPGFGGSTMNWASVHDGLARLTTTCAYDRAGLGFSDPRRDTITLTAVADDAREALRGAGVEGPFVLVGASMGGVFVRQFAAQHPAETVGLVLLDPGGPELQQAYGQIDQEEKRRADAQTEDLLKACVTQARSGELAQNPASHRFCVIPPDDSWSPALRDADQRLQQSVAYAEARLAEFELDDETLAAEARAPAALGDRPVIVLSADNGLSQAIPEPRRGQLIATRHIVDGAIARLSSRGEHRVVPDSSHSIGDDHPQVVIDAVAEVVAALQYPGDPSN